MGERRPKVGGGGDQTASRVATHELLKVGRDGVEELVDEELVGDSGIEDSVRTQDGLGNVVVGAVVGDVGETANTGDLRNGPGTEASPRAMAASCSP